MVLRRIRGAVEGLVPEDHVVRKQIFNKQYNIIGLFLRKLDYI